MSVWVRSWYSKAIIAQTAQHWSRHIILYFFTFLMWFLVDLEFIRRSHWRFQTSHFISKQEQKKEVNSSNRRNSFENIHKFIHSIKLPSYQTNYSSHFSCYCQFIWNGCFGRLFALFSVFFCCCVLGGRNKLEMVIKCIWLGTKWEPKMWTQMERNSDLMEWNSEPKKSRER